MRILVKLYGAYRSWKPFTEHEAWLLFKIGAFAEAIGWTLLIIGIILRDFVLHGNEVGVQLAGRLHGGFFMLYVLAVLLLSPSLGWGLVKTVFAGLCSIPPYGSLLFERWVANQRKLASIHYLKARLRLVLFLKSRKITTE